MWDFSAWIPLREKKKIFYKRFLDFFIQEYLAWGFSSRVSHLLRLPCLSWPSTDQWHSSAGAGPPSRLCGRSVRLYWLLPINLPSNLTNREMLKCWSGFFVFRGFSEGVTSVSLVVWDGRPAERSTRPPVSRMKVKPENSLFRVDLIPIWFQCVWHASSLLPHFLPSPLLFLFHILLIGVFHLIAIFQS